MEIDGYLDEPSQFYAAYQPMMFQNPEAAYTNSELMEYAKEYFTAAFSAMLNTEDFYALYNDEHISYTELFDITSIAQYVLIQEIFFNYDAAQKSNYVYKDVDSKAYMGPIWDMDWSSGRSHTYRSIEQWWSVCYTHEAVETLWYSGVIQDPYFLSVLKEVWDANRDTILSLTADDGALKQSYQYIYESAMANTELWAFDYGFEASYETFYSWMSDRLQWLDAQFADLDTLVASFDQYHANPAIQIRLSEDGIQVLSPTGTYAVLYYNGIRLSQRQLTDHSASWSVEEYSYTSDSDVIVIRVYDETGTLLGSNYTDLRD